MTGRDLVSASLRLIGAIASGETLEANEATDGLSALNLMISGWSNEDLLIFASVREPLTLTPSDGSYTMGPGGDLNTSRAQKIEQALIRIETVTPALELPLKIVNETQWATIPLKDVDSTYPIYLYADRAYPLETLNLWPRPNAAYKLVLYSLKALSSIATLDTTLSLPPGYERALKYNLAIEIAPEYGKAISAEVAKIADESKASIKRANHKPDYLQVDEALRTNRRSYNILTGDYS